MSRRALHATGTRPDQEGYVSSAAGRRAAPHIGAVRVGVGRAAGAAVGEGAVSAILRHRHTNRFTVLPNDAIRNPALSFRAVGVLAHLLSLPDGARVDSASLAASHKEGRDAVRAAFKELAAHGYYRRDLIRLPDGRLRTEVVVSSIPMDEANPTTTPEVAGRTKAGLSGSGTGAGFSGVGPEPEIPASAGPAPVASAAEEVPDLETDSPPNPPAQRGGHIDEATNPRRIQRRRAAGTNPRAEAAAAEAEQERAERARRLAAVEAADARRRSEEETARAHAAAVEAEALALSAVLDDARLSAVAALVTPHLAGPLARSPLAVGRAVLSWCRAAVHDTGPDAGSVVAAVDPRLTSGWQPDPETREAAGPLVLPASSPGTRPLRERLASQVLRPVDEDDRPGRPAPDPDAMTLPRPTAALLAASVEVS